MNNFTNQIVDKKRCSWCGNDPLYQQYHDNEWGKPVYDDAVFFELLLLETFQAGLSWITILRKRNNFRAAFDNFDYKLIANYDEPKLQELLQNEGIVRNRLKVYGSVTNAKLFMEIQLEFQSFNNYIWSFTNNVIVVNRPTDMSEIKSTSALSDQISADLKKRGFKFVGSTVIYAFLQATGIVNDHVKDCYLYSDLKNQ